MAKPTKIVLNHQSDLILTNALITSPSGLTQSDISGLVGNLSTRVSVEESLEALLSSDLSTEASARISGDESLETLLSVDISSELSSRVSGDLSLEANLSSEISRAIEAEGSIATVLSTEVSSIIANTDLTSIDSFAEVVADIKSKVAPGTEINFSQGRGMGFATEPWMNEIILRAAKKLDAREEQQCVPA